MVPLEKKTLRQYKTKSYAASTISCQRGPSTHHLDPQIPVIMVENGSATPAYAHEILGDIKTMHNESKCRPSTINQIIQ